MKFKNLDKYTKYAYLVIIIGTLIRFILTSLSYPSGDACWHLSISRFIAINQTIPLFEHLGREVFWVFPFLDASVAATFEISSTS